MQQFLHEPRGTQPAADGPAQGDPEEQQDAQHVKRRAVPGGGQGVLQRA